MTSQQQSHEKEKKRKKKNKDKGKNKEVKKKYRKKAIPSSLKHAVWVHYNGKRFECKCCVAWCPNTVDVFSFEAGHDVPESKGGATTIDNLRPICSSCNRSMSNLYTIQEYSTLFLPATASDSNVTTTISVQNPQFEVLHTQPTTTQHHLIGLSHEIHSSLSSYIS